MNVPAAACVPGRSPANRRERPFDRAAGVGPAFGVPGKRCMRPLLTGMSHAPAREAGLALRPRRRVKVPRLVGHPRDEARHGLACEQRLSGTAGPGQRGVGEMGVDRPVADRMDRHRLAPAFRLRHAMVPLHLVAERPMAEPAARRRGLAQRSGLAGSGARPRHHRNSPAPTMTAAPSSAVASGQSPKKIAPRATAISSWP